MTASPSSRPSGRTQRHRRARRHERGAMRSSRSGRAASPLVADVRSRGGRAREEPPFAGSTRPSTMVRWSCQGRERASKRPRSSATAAPCGGLDGGAPIAGVDHLTEEPLEIDRLGRRERRRPPLTPDLPFDRPDETGPPTCRLEYRPEQERRRRLPIRPGHAGELELLRRLTEERGRDGHRLARDGREPTSVTRSTKPQRRLIASGEIVPSTGHPEHKRAPAAPAVSYARSPISTGRSRSPARCERQGQSVELHLPEGS
jgi:hypothetical protein